jgi:hypothetical protein
VGPKTDLDAVAKIGYPKIAHQEVNIIFFQESLSNSEMMTT